MGTIPELPHVHAADARQVVDAALREGGGWLAPDEAQALMSHAGITVAPARLVVSADDAANAAASLGLPVALKAVGRGLLHKTERDAVRLNLADEPSVHRAAHELARRFGSELDGLLVQRMVSGGVEMLVGAVHDPMFGPLVVCGTGGVLVDLLADSAVRIHPLTADDAASMIEELRGVRLLRGYRGRPAADEATLRDTLLRVSALLTICPEVQELDINPLMVLTAGACAVDVRVRVEREAPGERPRRMEY